MSEIQTTQTFQEKMFNRIRDNIGDLMSDEDLKKLVDSAVKKAFFEERKVEAGYCRTEMKPSVFLEMMQNELRDTVSLAIKNWLEQNKDQVDKAISDAIGQGFFGIIENYMKGMMLEPMRIFSDKLRENGLIKY